MRDARSYFVRRPSFGLTGCRQSTRTNLNLPKPAVRERRGWGDTGDWTAQPAKTGHRCTEIGLVKSAHVRSAVGCAKWPPNISYQRDCPPLSTHQSRQPISLDTGHGYDDCTGRNSDLVMCLFSCDGRNPRT